MSTVKLSGTGVWNAGLAFGDPAEIVDAAAELEELGYTSIWFPGYGAGCFDAAERLLAASRNVTVATGILSIWVYSPEDAAAGHHRLADTYGDRFLLGLGVSHAALVDAQSNPGRYAKPLSAMRTFLDGLDSAATPVDPDARVLAALGPKMLELAGGRAGGAHPYNVTAEHTVRAREVLGPDRLLVPEQAVALATSAVEGRRLGREFLGPYLQLPNYANSLRRLGFTDDDMAHRGSDRLVDALIARGDEDTIAARVRAHRDAGADSVCVQVLTDAGMVAMTRREWRDLAPVLTALSG